MLSGLMAVSCSRRCSQAHCGPLTHGCPIGVEPRKRDEVPLAPVGLLLPRDSGELPAHATCLWRLDPTTAV